MIQKDPTILWRWLKPRPHALIWLNDFAKLQTAEEAATGNCSLKISCVLTSSGDFPKQAIYQGLTLAGKG